MSFLSGLENSAFRVKDGVTSFFPYGAMSKGYIIPSLEEPKLRRFVRSYYLAMLLVLVIPQFIFGIVGVIPIGFLFVAAYWAVIRKWSGNWQPISERLTIREAQESTAQEMGMATLIALLASSVAMSLASVWLAFHKNERFVASAGAVFFGFCAWTFLGMLLRRKKG